MGRTYVIVAGHNQADHKDAANIEYEDTPERPSDGNWYVLPRCLRLTDSHADELGSNIGKERVG